MGKKEQNEQREAKQEERNADGETKMRWQIPNFLRKNWGYKLLALACGFLFWIFVLYGDKSVKRSRLIEVPLTLLNEDALSNENHLVISSDRSEIPKTVLVKVSSKIEEYPQINTNNISAVIDLANVDTPGMTDLRVGIQSQLSDDVTFVSREPSIVSIDFDKQDSIRLPLTVKFAGKLPEGYWHGDATLSPSFIELTGPQSEIERVKEVVCTIQLGGLKSPINQSVRTVIRDRDGWEIDAEVFPQSISVVAASMDVYPKKSVAIDSSAVIPDKNLVKQGYAIDAIHMSLNRIEIAGPQEILDEIDTVPLEPLERNELTDADRTFTTQLPIRLPKKVTANYETVNVTVEIGEVMVSKTFDDFAVGKEGIDDGLDAAMSLWGERCSITLTGPESVINEISRGDLRARVNLVNYPAGTYTLPIEVQLPEDIEQKIEVSVVPSEVSMVVSKEK